MPKLRTESDKAAGKLVKTIQREWMEQIELGSKNAEVAEEKLGLAHTLLQAKTAQAMREVIGYKSVQQYFGSLWVNSYPLVKEAVSKLEVAIESESV